MLERIRADKSFLIGFPKIKNEYVVLTNWKRSYRAYVIKAVVLYVNVVYDTKISCWNLADTTSLKRSSD